MRSDKREIVERRHILSRLSHCLLSVHRKWLKQHVTQGELARLAESREPKSKARDNRQSKQPLERGRESQTYGSLRLRRLYGALLTTCLPRHFHTTAAPTLSTELAHASENLQHPCSPPCFLIYRKGSFVRLGIMAALNSRPSMCG
jgi:hypothetical protein